VTFTSSASNLVSPDTNQGFDLYVRDLRNRTTTRISVSTAGTQAQGGSWESAISANGRYVAFRSEAGNLVPADTNGAPDIFVRDLQAGTTTRVSVSDRGAEGNGYASLTPAISADGRHVAFSSGSTNLVAADTNDTQDIFVHSAPR
jgi:Tol biopolymer transport system component